MKNLNEIIKVAIIKEQGEIESLFKIAKEVSGIENPKRFLIKSIIIDLHLSLDFFMSLCLATRLMDSKEVKQIMIVMPWWEKIFFGRKMSLIKKLKILTPNQEETLKQLNELRIKFVHLDYKGKKKLEYKGKSLFILETIKKISKDVRSVKSVLVGKS